MRWTWLNEPKIAERYVTPGGKNVVILEAGEDRVVIYLDQLESLFTVKEAPRLEYSALAQSYNLNQLADMQHQTLGNRGGLAHTLGGLLR